jgi:hypothetical protein
MFSEADYSSGETPQQWGRNSEINATQKILDPYLPGGRRVISIALQLDYPPDSWIELPENPDHPGESWYTKTVSYDLVARTVDQWEYRAIDLVAQFTIRWDDSAGRWQIVLWRDDVGNQIKLSPGGIAVASSTWGSIKALYS